MIKGLKLIGFFSGMAALVWLASCLGNDDVFDSAEQLEKDRLLIDQYISDNGLTVQTDTGGYELKYIMHEEGTGEAPVANDILFLDYKGSLLSNGEVFDDRDSVYLQLSNLILGWHILIPYLREGGEMTMFLPSYFGYGHTSSESIPKDASLIFNVRLHEIVTLDEYEQRQIDAYLDEENLQAQTDTVAGLKYIINEAGTGNYPKLTDKVNVTYTGRLLSNEAVFDTGKSITFTLSSLIEGWEILLPYVSEGGKITMYIPSKYAYGSKGYGNVPPNASLIFEVTLNSIVVD